MESCGWREEWEKRVCVLSFSTTGVWRSITPVTQPLGNMRHRVILGGAYLERKVWKYGKYYSKYMNLYSQYEYFSYSRHKYFEKVKSLINFQEIEYLG